jgi:PTH1 family peptidyl-tRNA hydrolase
MKLIVGLGNPGPEYDRTRHNVGFEVVDSLARRHAPGEVARAKFHAVLLDATIAGEKVILAKPTTYMNLSGSAVGEIIRFYKIDPASDLLVIVDDVALDCGLIRMRADGSAGGHNGLADVEQKLSSQQWARLRVGVGAPGPAPQKDYVLGKFRPDQREAVEQALDDAVEAAECWVERGVQETMNRYNRKQSAYSQDTATPS